MLLAIAPTPQWTLHFLVPITRLPSRACFGAAHYPMQGYPGGPILELCLPIIHCKVTQEGPPSSGGQVHSRTVQCKVTNKGPTPMGGCIAQHSCTIQCRAHFPVQKLHCPAQLHYPVQGGGLHFPAQLQHYPVQGPLSSGEHYPVQG